MFVQGILAEFIWVNVMHLKSGGDLGYFNYLNCLYGAMHKEDTSLTRW